jgi:hypothetical protein
MKVFIILNSDFCVKKYIDSSGNRVWFFGARTISQYPTTEKILRLFISSNITPFTLVGSYQFQEQYELVKQKQIFCQRFNWGLG